MNECHFDIFRVLTSTSAQRKATRRQEYNENLNVRVPIYLRVESKKLEWNTWIEPVILVLAMRPPIHSREQVWETLENWKKYSSNNVMK